MTKIAKYSLGKSHRKFLKYLEFFWITFEPETVEGQSTAPKTHIIA